MIKGKATQKKGTKAVQVEVIADKFGTYKKGDTLKMHPTTAAACAKNKAVKVLK